MGARSSDTRAADTRAAPGSPPTGSPTPALLLPLLSLAGFLVSMDSRVIATVLPQIASDFTVSIPAAGAAVTAYLLPYGLCQLVYGPLGDRVGAMRVISIATIAFTVGAAVCALAPNLASLIALRLLTGSVAAAIIPLSLATIGNVTAYSDRQAAIATLLGATALGQVLSAAIGGVMAEALSWRAIFLVDGLLGALLVAPLWRLRHATPPLAIRGGGHPFTEHLALARDRRALALYAAVMVEGAFLNGGFTYLGALLREREGLSFLLIGLSLSLFGVASLLTSRVVARLGQRLGENRLIWSGCLLMAAGFLIPWLLPDWRVVAGATLLMGMGFTLCHSTFQTRATELRPGARGTAISLFAFTLFLGGGVGTALLGALLAAASYDAILLTCGVGLLLLAVLAPRLTAPRRQLARIGVARPRAALERSSGPRQRRQEADDG